MSDILITPNRVYGGTGTNPRIDFLGVSGSGMRLEVTEQGYLAILSSGVTGAGFGPVDARLGIGTSSPAATFHSTGLVRLDSNLQFSNDTTTNLYRTATGQIATDSVFMVQANGVASKVAVAVGADQTVGLIKPSNGALGLVANGALGLIVGANLMVSLTSGLTFASTGDYTTASGALSVAQARAISGALAATISASAAGVSTFNGLSGALNLGTAPAPANYVTFSTSGSNFLLSGLANPTFTTATVTGITFAGGAKLTGDGGNFYAMFAGSNEYRVQTTAGDMAFKVKGQNAASISIDRATSTAGGPLQFQIAGSNDYRIGPNIADTNADLGVWVDGGPGLAMAVKKATANVLFGGATGDNLNGKVQLATHTTSGGGVGFGPNASLYSSSTNNLTQVGGADPRFNVLSAGAVNAFVQGSDTAGQAIFGSSSNHTVAIRANSTTALTLAPTTLLATFTSGVTIGGALTLGGVTVSGNGGSLYVPSLIGNPGSTLAISSAGGQNLSLVPGAGGNLTLNSSSVQIVDSNTTIDRIAASVLAVKTAGVEAARWDATQNLIARSGIFFASTGDYTRSGAASVAQLIAVSGVLAGASTPAVTRTTYPALRVTGSFTVATGNSRYVWTGTATAIGTLPSIAINSGLEVVVKNVSTAAVLTLSGTVDNALNYALYPNSSATVWSDGISWLLI